MIRTFLLAAALAALTPPAAFAGGRSGNQNQVLEQIHQTRTGDYSYTVDHNGRRRPRHWHPPFHAYDRRSGDEHGRYGTFEIPRHRR